MKTTLRPYRQPRRVRATAPYVHTDRYGYEHHYLRLQFVRLESRSGNTFHSGWQTLGMIEL